MSRNRAAAAFVAFSLSFSAGVRGASDRDRLLVSVDWLAAHLHDPALVLLHVGDPAGYAAAHLPGARLAALREVSAGPSGPGDFPELRLEMLPAEELRRRLEALGISDGSRIVVYFGEDWVSPSTRLLFTLDYAGLGANVSLLDGGQPAWVRAERPVASTIKPLIYAAALESGIAPCDYLDNTDKVYADHDDWHPRNFNDSSGGRVAMWYALAHSMNLPTVDLYFRTDQAKLAATFKGLGLPTKDIDKPALSLGASDISLARMAAAYGAFAARGNRTPIRTIERITDAQGKVLYQAKAAPHTRAMDAATAAAITRMLQRAVNEGTGAALRSRHRVKCELAGKTGTSQDYGDAWFIGYTPGLVIGTWVGAMDPDIHFSSGAGTGSRLALPIAGQVLAAMERTPGLRKRYLLPFDWLSTYDIDLDCEPVREGGFLENLFAPDKRSADAADTTAEKERQGFWRRLFPKRR